MSEARLEAAEDKGVDVFGFIARFAPTLFLIALMLLFAIMAPNATQLLTAAEAIDTRAICLARGTCFSKS